MSPLAIAILIGALASAGLGGGWALEHRGRVSEREAAQVAAQDAAGALAACEARTVPETVQASAQGTTDALTATLAPYMAQVGVEASLIQALSQDRYSVALVDVASPRLLAAEAAMTRCALLVQSKDSAILGCGKEVVEAWAEAVSALPACAEGGE